MPGTFLIALTVSPVQRFIREARKAQDLWSSSLLLSHMAVRMARELDTRGARVILPHPGFDPGREPTEPHRPRVTNEVMALFHGGEEVASTVAAEAARETRDWWVNDVAGQTKRCLLDANLFREEELRLWDEQVRAQFRIVWATAPLPNETDPSAAAQAFEQLQVLLAGAKQCRTVDRYLGDYRPKCTLCGQWEQMGPAFPQADARAVPVSLQFWREIFSARLDTIRHDRRWCEPARAVTARIESDGRERLCAVCLTKRLAPVLVLAPKYGWDAEDVHSPLRFPSTTVMAWADQKERLARAISTGLAAPLQELRRAAEAVKSATGLPLGRHWFHWYDRLTEIAPDEVRTSLRGFLELDGSWLSMQDREEAVRSGRPRRPSAGAAWDRLKEAHKGLKKVVEARQIEGVNLNRTPPLVLLRADADRLGKRLSSEIAQGHLGRAEELSKVLATKALKRAVDQVEGPCRGKVIFAGGDELLAMLPAIHALRAAEEVALAYSDEAAKAGFPGLTCSVATAVIHAHQPLRLAIEELNHLLERTKGLRRPAPWLPDRTEPLDRHAFGLAIIPGSGNVKRGSIGLELPVFSEDGGPPTGTCRAVGDVLLPLAEILALPEVAGVRVSPKLFREWIETFEVRSPSFDRGPVAFPDEFLPDGDVEGMALAEFGRLANRHVEVVREFRRGWSSGNILVGSLPIDEWFRALLGATPPDDADEMRRQIVTALKWRLRSLLLSGSVRDGARCERGAAWENVSGLLLAVTSLGTREIG